MNCAWAQGLKTVDVTGEVGDTFTVTQILNGACWLSVNTSPGVVGWVTNAPSGAGAQNPSALWGSAPAGGNPTVTFTLLQPGRTQWRALQRSDGLTINFTVLEAPQVEPLTVAAVSRLEPGLEEEPYRAELSAQGGSVPYTWAVKSGQLPPGLSLAGNGAVTGTPTAAGTYSFTAQVTDDTGQQADVELEIVIEPAAVSAENVPICHATSDGYELTTTTEEVFGRKGAHGDHASDIVPDLLAEGRGRNWDATGIATFFNGCEPVAGTVLDTDTDGLPDLFDADDDGDGLADVADSDDDGDGVADASDPDSVVAPDQDADGLPDALDPDDDGDCILDAGDTDSDGDGIVDSADRDHDNDGIPDSVDVDQDGDGIPNLLDLDVDGDGVANGDGSSSRSVRAKSACVSNQDADGDRIPNTKDSDDDGDGIPDAVDTPAERPWVDTDLDGIPNVDDVDLDGDGIPNAVDPDLDGDDVPNVRDVDDDGDGLADARSTSSSGKAVRPVRASTTVTFAPLSDVLSSGAREQLRGLVKKAGRSPSTVVSIGYVQESGTSSNDAQLSNARARAAASYLASLGVKSVYTVRGDGIGGAGPTARKVVVTVVKRP